MAEAVFTKLSNRAFIAITGTDRFDFLQGLITQDINLLQSQNLIYSCLLTPNGKFLFDFFLFNHGDVIIIDCEGGERANALLKRLSMFKLRSNVDLELVDHIDIYQIFSTETSCPEFKDGNDGFLRKDPRFNGYRVYPSPSFLRSDDEDPNLNWNDNFKKVDFNIWDIYRIQHRIPDGSRDMIPEKSFIHESEIIATHGVSYDKGCYMGQELVSRMHHRGLVKKQLRCVELQNITEQMELRSQSGDVGLALIKV